MRDALVVAQMALALDLLVGAGLMIRSLLALDQVQPGFERPDEVLTARVSIPSAEIDDPERVVLAFEEMHRGLEAIPGVTSVGASSRITMDGMPPSESPLVVEGFPVPEEQLPQSRRYKWFFRVTSRPCSTQCEQAARSHGQTSMRARPSPSLRRI